MIKMMEKVSGRELPYRLEARREGDVGEVVGNPKKSNALLGWKTTRGLKEMCRDSWRWQDLNPKGYRSDAALEDKTYSANAFDSDESRS